MNEHPPSSFSKRRAAQRKLPQRQSLAHPQTRHPLPPHGTEHQCPHGRVRPDLVQGRAPDRAARLEREQLYRAVVLSGRRDTRLGAYIPACMEMRGIFVPWEREQRLPPVAAGLLAEEAHVVEGHGVLEPRDQDLMGVDASNVRYRACVADARPFSLGGA